jgi:hypothetical protein
MNYEEFITDLKTFVSKHIREIIVYTTALIGLYVSSWF